MVDHVIKGTKGGVEIFKEDTAALEGEPTFVSGGDGQVSSNNDAIEIDETYKITPKTVKSYYDTTDPKVNPIKLSYLLKKEDSANWTLTLKVKGKSAEDKDLSVEAVASYDKDNMRLVIGEKESKFDTQYANYVPDPIFNLGPIKTITEIKDVQTEDANTLKNFLNETGIDASFTGVEFETDLSNIGLIYKDYKMVSVDNDDWSATFDDNKLKVTKKKSTATTDSLTLTFYTGDPYQGDGSNTLCQITGEYIKVNTDTKTADAGAISVAVKDASLDLSCVGDSNEVTFTQAFTGNYSIELDEPYSEFYSATIEKQTLTFKRIKMGWPSEETDKHQIKFKVYWKLGEGSDREYLNDDGFIVNEVNEKTRIDDAEVVTNALKDTVTFTYGDSAKTITGKKLGLMHKNYTMRETTVTDSSGKKIAKVTFDDAYNLKVEPINAGSGNAKLEFEVTDPFSGALNDDDNYFKISVKVNKKELTWNDEVLPTGGKTAALDYRYLDDQKTYVKTKIKDWVSGSVGKDDVKLNVNDIAFTDYPTTDVSAETTSFTVSGIKTENSNYTFKNSGNESSETSLNLKVKKIVSQDYTKLSNFTFKGKQGDGNEVDVKDDVWVNNGVWVKWDGHTLADAVTNTKNNNDLPANTSKEYVEKLSPDALNPDSEGASIKASKIYAKDSKTNVISKITDLKVNIDKTAPVVSSFSVNTGGVKEKTVAEKVIDFFFPSNIRAKVSMNATDNSSEAGSVSDILKDSKAKVYYNDNGKDAWHDIEFENTEKYPFSFEVDAADVDRIKDNFKVELTDNAMNTNKDAAKSAQGLPTEVWELVQNNVAPSVSITFDNNDVRNGSFYNDNRKVTVQVTADHFDLTRTYDETNQVIVTLTINGNEQKIRINEFGDDGKWERTFSEDADYTLKADYLDLSGQSCSATADSWTIDKTRPEVGIIWDNDNVTNGNYYAASRTATVTINEHNFDASMFQVEPTGNGGNASEYGAPSVSDWTHDGDSHQCHVYFPGQGNYQMTVTGEDCAKNALETLNVSEFVVDTIQPEITVSVNGETDAASHAYPDNANVSVAINDTNVDSSSQINVESISWNGNGTPYAENRGSSATSVTVDMPNPENKPESDGVYRVTINAQDLAGNTQTKTVDWSVNRFGSTYVVSDSTKGIITKKYVKSKDMSDVAITEINPSGVNADSATAKVARGTNTQTIQKGQGFTFAEASESNGWPAFTYTISKDKYSSDAMYQTIVSSTDSAGRASDNTMADKSNDRKNSCDVSFAVDNTAPIVSFTGFEDGIVASREHTVNAYIEDNMKLDHAVVEVNGIEVQSLDGSDLSDKDHQITLYESGDTQKLTIKAYDAAGNVCNIDSSDIFINNDPLARLMHNTVLFVSLLVGGLVLIGTLVWYFFFYKRRKDEEEQQA